MAETPLITLLRARKQAAELRTRAAHQSDQAQHYARQAQHPAYEGQSERCECERDKITSLAAENRARADLIEAEAEAAYRQATGEEPPKP